MVSKLPNVTWPKGAFVETIKTWQKEWFYITEPRGSKWAAAPVFRSGPPLRLASWTNKGLDWGSSDEVLMLLKHIKSMIAKDGLSKCGSSIRKGHGPCSGSKTRSIKGFGN